MRLVRFKKPLQTPPGEAFAFAPNIDLKFLSREVVQSCAILFSQQFSPMFAVNRGDSYVLEGSFSVAAVMDRLGHTHTSPFARMAFSSWAYCVNMATD
jgi:hypothetical protein